jgi:hypothetical protein
VPHLWHFNRNNIHFAVSFAISCIRLRLCNLLPSKTSIYICKYLTDIANVSMRLLNVEMKERNDGRAWNHVEHSGLFSVRLPISSSHIDGPQVLLTHNNHKVPTRIYGAFFRLYRFPVRQRLFCSPWCQDWLWIRGPFEKYVDWRQCATVTQREAVTVMPSCSDGGNVVVAWPSSL